MAVRVTDKARTSAVAGLTTISCQVVILMVINVLWLSDLTLPCDITGPRPPVKLTTITWSTAIHAQLIVVNLTTTAASLHTIHI